MTIRFTVGLDSVEEGPRQDALSEPSPWLDELARAHEQSARSQRESDARTSRRQGWLLSGTEQSEDSTGAAIWAW